MASLIKGTTVILYDKVQSGTDEFGRAVYEETAVEVENVLIAPASGTEVLDTTSVNGKKAVYTLGIPKDDEHEWDDRTVEFFGQKWRTFGFSTYGMEDLIPLDWNRKVQVDRVG